MELLQQLEGGMNGGAGRGRPMGGGGMGRPGGRPIGTLYLGILMIHGINSDLEAKLSKIFKNGSVSQSQWLLYSGKKNLPKNL